MKRRKAIQSIAIGALGSGIFIRSNEIFAQPPRMNSVGASFTSQWQQMLDMVWLRSTGRTGYKTGDCGSGY